MFKEISEYFYAQQVSPEQLDYLLSKAWRHFGEYFFRYSQGVITTDLLRVAPLRIRLSDFCFSKSQKKILRKNEKFILQLQDAHINTEKEILFEKHKQRFSENTPKSLHNFLSPAPAAAPTHTCELCLYDGQRLIAVSFIDVGDTSLSSVYAMFDTEYGAYSLGIFTLLEEIKWAKSQGKQYLYLGYAFEQDSFYDYKKRFSGLECYNWHLEDWEAYVRK